MTLLIVLKSMILTFFLTVILGQLGNSLPCCPQSRIFCTLSAVLVQRGQFGWFLPQWCSAGHWMRSSGSWSLASLPNTPPQAAARSTGVKLCCWNSSGWTEYETDLERKRVILITPSQLHEKYPPTFCWEASLTPPLPVKGRGFQIPDLGKTSAQCPLAGYTEGYLASQPSISTSQKSFLLPNE